MLKEISFKSFKNLLRKSKLKAITIGVVNVEGHQEGAVRGYNPKKPGSNCYNIQFAFCDELKAYITGFVRSGNTYTANGAVELIKEIVAHMIWKSCSAWKVGISTTKLLKPSNQPNASI